MYIIYSLCNIHKSTEAHGIILYKYWAYSLSMAGLLWIVVKVTASVLDIVSVYLYEYLFLP